MENLKVMIRKLGATGLEFQAGLYIEKGNCHDLVAEVYSIKRANQLSAFPDLLEACELALLLMPSHHRMPPKKYVDCRNKLETAIAKARGEQ